MARPKVKTKKVLGVKITRGEVPDEDWTLIHKVAISLEKGRFAEYVDILQDTKKLLWKSFVSGVGRGFGVVVGATVVVAIVVAVLALIGDLWPGEDPSENIKEKIESNTTR